MAGERWVPPPGARRRHPGLWGQAGRVAGSRGAGSGACGDNVPVEAAVTDGDKRPRCSRRGLNGSSVPGQRVSGGRVARGGRRHPGSAPGSRAVPGRSPAPLRQPLPLLSPSPFPGPPSP